MPEADRARTSRAARKQPERVGSQRDPEETAALVHLPVPERHDTPWSVDPARVGDVDEWGRSESMRALARTLYAPLYEKWFRVEWEGLEKIPTEGGALIVANHAAAIPSDAPAIMHGIETELERPVYGLADQYFKRLPVVGTMWSRTGSTVAPLPLDVYMTQDSIVVLAAAPGLSPDQFQLTYNQGTLQLSGTINNVADSHDAKGATWYVHELWSGQVQRAVSLPVEVDVDHAQASFEHGIVKIVLPKAEQAKPKSIPISTKQTQAIRSGK